MSMRALDDLRKQFCEELEEIARKGELGAGDLDIVHKLTDTIKNIDKIGIMEEEGGYSQAGDWEVRGRVGRYDDGNSYRGRRRDSMGRYSRDSGREGGYSRDGGKDTIMEHIEMMMAEATTEPERDMIRRFKKQLQDM